MQMTPVASGSETETWKDPPSNITMKHYEAWTAQTVYEVLTLEMIKLKLETQNLN